MRIRLAHGITASMWRDRILYGTLAVAGLIGVLALDAFLSREAAGAGGVKGLVLHGMITTAVVALLAVGGAVEACALARAAGHDPARRVVVAAAFILVLIPWFMRAGMPLPPSGPGAWADWKWTGVAMAAAFMLIGVAAMRASELNGSIARIGTSCMMILYVGFLGSFVVRLRQAVPGPDGAWVLLYFLLVVKSADIGAYAAGRFFGRRKVVPRISPNKTLEGFIGGGVMAVLVALAAAPVLLGEGPLAEEGVRWARGQSIVFGVAMAIVGPLGDLFESLLKRDAGVKDSGQCIPPFGGFLDLIDSPLFAAPVAWWLLTRGLLGG